MRNLSKLVKDYVVPMPIVLQSEQTIEAAIQSLRKQQVDEKIIYFYVVDAKKTTQRSSFHPYTFVKRF